MFLKPDLKLSVAFMSFCICRLKLIQEEMNCYREVETLGLAKRAKRSYAHC